MSDRFDFIPENGTLQDRDLKHANWILIGAENTLIIPDTKGWQPLDADSYRWSGVTTQSEHYLGRWNDRPLCLAELAPDCSTPDDWRQLPLRSALPLLSRSDFAIISRAQQVLTWWRDHQWCGRCGTRTRTVGTERACHCPACKAFWYPRLTPCIIVLPVRGEELLLGRNANFPGHFYSALAGFVEPGETLEEALVREVQEETGIAISNPRYFASQTWPFPSQLMIGFFADYASGSPIPDGKEIVDVNWYHYRSLPQVPPAGFSIAGDLIARATEQLAADKPV